MSKESREFWAQYQKDYAIIDMGAMLDAYAAAKDAEIARLQIEVENLKSYQQSLECDNFHANAHADTFEAEIDRLNFQLSEANRVLDAGRDRITALKADNARLREGIAKEAKIQRDVLRCEIDEGMHSPPKRIRECVAEDLEKLLSPADGDGVEETKPKNLICVRCKHLVRARTESDIDRCGAGHWYGERSDSPIDEYFVDVDPWIQDGCFEPLVDAGRGIEG